MKRFVLALVFVLALPLGAMAAEIGEYQVQINLLTNMLVELKQTDAFARMGFDAKNTDAAEWRKSVLDLKKEFGGQKLPWQVSEAPQLLLDLGETYWQARKNGMAFKDVTAFDAYEESITNARMRLSLAIGYVPEK